MTDIRDLRWLAGWLEGEGCFTWSAAADKPRKPLIVVLTTDLDIAERAARIFGTRVYTKRYPRKPTHKIGHVVRVFGSRAAAWMMTLYLLMGQRRRERIKEILTDWRAVKLAPGSVKRTWHSLAA